MKTMIMASLMAASMVTSFSTAFAGSMPHAPMSGDGFLLSVQYNTLPAVKDTETTIKATYKKTLREAVIRREGVHKPSQTTAHFGIGYTEDKERNLFNYEYERLNVFLGAKRHMGKQGELKAWARVSPTDASGTTVDAGMKMGYRLSSKVSAHGLLLMTDKKNFDESSQFCFFACEENSVVSVGAGIDIQFQ